MHRLCVKYFTHISVTSQMPFSGLGRLSYFYRVNRPRKIHISEELGFESRCLALVLVDFPVIPWLPSRYPASGG